MSCVKKGDFNIKLKVISEATGNPVQSQVTIQYQKRPGPSQPIQEAKVGTTDENGELHIKYSLPRKTYNHVLVVYATGYSNIWKQEAAKKSVNPGQKSEFTLKVTPNYHYLLSLKNTSCYDETDSVSVTSNIPYGTIIRYAGCVDTIVKFGQSTSYIFTFWSFNPNVVFNVTVKRNGITSFFQHPVTLIVGQITPVHIDY